MGKKRPNKPGFHRQSGFLSHDHVRLARDPRTHGPGAERQPRRPQTQNQTSDPQLWTGKNPDHQTHNTRPSERNGRQARRRNPNTGRSNFLRTNKPSCQAELEGRWYKWTCCCRAVCCFQKMPEKLVVAH